MLFGSWVFSRVDVGSDIDVSEAAYTTEVSKTLPTSTPCKHLKSQIMTTINP
jgi:hypothetical protein